jgi:hypothetical protein
MKLRPAVVLVAVLTISSIVVAQSKPKKHSDVSAVFANARFVFVRAEAGDVQRPSLYPEDRQAIGDMQDGLRDWNRYALAMRREDADLVFVIRKGRAVGEQNRGGISVGRPNPQGPPNQGRTPGQDPGDEIGLSADAGPSDDTLEVYATNPDGKLIGPLWKREMRDGLEGPNVPLLQQLRAAVDRAYPLQPAPKP